MASSFFSLVLVFLFLKASLISCNVITDVCSEAPNKPICYNTLKSDPRSAKADVKGIGYISLEISKKYAEETYKYVDYLFKKAEIGPKGKFGACLRSYEDIIDLLSEARKSLDKFDISTFRTDTAAAFDGIFDCEDAFGKGSVPKQLEEANTKSRGSIGITVAVGYLLAGKH